MREMSVDWIRCPICGSKTRDRLRGYNFEELSSLLPQMQTGNFNQCKKFTYSRYQRARRFRRRADELVSNHSLSAYFFICWFLLHIKPLFLQ